MCHQIWRPRREERSGKGSASTPHPAEVNYVAPVEFRRVGDSGLVVSVVGLGTNNFGMKLDEEHSREVVRAVLDEGITLFDTTDAY